jgi:hypothetical protein
MGTDTCCFLRLRGQPFYSLMPWFDPDLQKFSVRLAWRLMTSAFAAATIGKANLNIRGTAP